jgi:thioredoxin reductase (NADPH)
MTPQLAAKPQAKTIIVEEKKDLDLAIVGGGPAGLSAAIYALRAGLKTILFEKMVLGGLASTTYQIDNYPGFPDSISGIDLSQRMADQARKLGLEIVWGSVTEIKNDKNHRQLKIDGKTLSAKAVIIAAGTEAAKLDVPGEEEFRGKGVSYCATCDGAFYQGKNILVVGGGNAAVEEALFLTRYAAKVSIVHRRDRLRADKIVAEKAMAHPKIYFFWHSAVEEILGDKNVKEAVLKDLLSGNKLRVPVDGIFIYTGSRPNSDPVKNLVKVNNQGFILTDEKMRTSAPGIFAAGDIREKGLRQVVTAAADGAIAAESARQFIEKIEPAA